MSYDSLNATASRTSCQKAAPVHKASNKGVYLLFGALLVCVLGFSLSVTDQSVTAQSTFPDPNAGCPHATCGEVSPLIPMQSTEAVHMGLVWKRNSDTPKILFHARFPEYTPNDVADPALIDLAIARGAFSTPGLQFNSSLRDVLHGFDPFLGLGHESYQQTTRFNDSPTAAI